MFPSQLRQHADGPFYGYAVPERFAYRDSWQALPG